MLVCLSVLVREVEDICSPCQCLPNDTQPRYLICQGWNVAEYPPHLDAGEKMALREIYVTETFIPCLPKFDSEDYGALELFDESNNIALNCSCLLSWSKVNTFNSDCDFERESTATMITEQLISHPDESLTSSDAEGGCCRSGSSEGVSALPLGAPSPPGPGGRWPRPTLAAALIGIITLIPATIIVAFLVRKCCKRSRDCCWRRRGVVTSNIPLHVINPIYTGPDLEWE